MLETMTKLQTVYLSSGSQGTISFTNIPQNYTHLQIRMLSRVTGNVSTTAYSATGYINLNNDSGSNYSTHQLYGNGSSATSSGVYSGTSIVLNDLAGPYSGQTSNTFGAAVLDILDYANTSKYKTVCALYGEDLNGYGRVFLSSGSWQSFAPVSSIQITGSDGGGGFAQYSHIALYGIA